MNELPVLDPRALQSLLDLGAPPELVQELVVLFETDVPPRIEWLRGALSGFDVPRARAEAHQLKGALGNLGLARFADLAASIEIHVEEGRLDQAALVADGLPAAYEEAKRALSAAFPQPTPFTRSNAHPG